MTVRAGKRSSGASSSRVAALRAAASRVPQYDRQTQLREGPTLSAGLGAAARVREGTRPGACAQGRTQPGASLRLVGPSIEARQAQTRVKA